VTVTGNPAAKEVAALILAAGTGSRLSVLTRDRPKCMVELAGRPLIARQIEVLRASAVSAVTVVGGYRSECLRVLDVDLIENRDYADSNMVWSMMCARALFDGSRPIVMAYGDIVYEPAVLEALLRAEGPVTVAADRGWRALWEARMEDPLADAESFRVDAEGRVVELGQRARDLNSIEGQYIGLVRFDPPAHAHVLSLYDELSRQPTVRGRPFRQMYMTDFLQCQVDAGWPPRVAWIEHGWLEVDTVDDLETYERLWAEGRLEHLCRLAVV